MPPRSRSSARVSPDSPPRIPLADIGRRKALGRKPLGDRLANSPATGGAMVTAVPDPPAWDLITTQPPPAHHSPRLWLRNVLMPSHAARPRSVASVVTNATPTWAATASRRRTRRSTALRLSPAGITKRTRIGLDHPHLRLDGRQGVLRRKIDRLGSLQLLPHDLRHLGQQAAGRSFDRSRPPAWASAGLPPPPPTVRASALTISPACTPRRTRRRNDHLRLVVDGRGQRTTADPIDSRNDRSSRAASGGPHRPPGP